MVLHLVQRAGTFVTSLLMSTLVIFVFIAVLPGDPARVALGITATDDAVAELRGQFGLDRPLATQYLDWLHDLVTFNLGDSYVSRAAIGPQITDRIQVTLTLIAAGMLIALAIAIPVGMLMAVRHRRLSGFALSSATQVGVAVPGFLAGILLVTLFAVRLRWLPANGWTPPGEDFAMFLKQLALPALSLGLTEAAILSRYVRSAVLDVLGEDYLRTARAKGLRPGSALVRHGLRNAAIPVVTVLALHLATLLVGTIVIERVFVIPGLGSLLLDGVSQRDLIVVQDIVMLLVVAVLIVNFVVELLYVVIDPRLRGNS